MSNRLDLLNNTVRGVSHNAAAATTNNTAGSSVDMVNAENPITGFVFVSGVTAAGASFQVKFQESTDGTTWADITGASIAAATTSGVSAVTMVRQYQYLRSFNTQGSSNAYPLISYLVAPLKQSP